MLGIPDGARFAQLGKTSLLWKSDGQKVAAKTNALPMTKSTTSPPMTHCLLSPLSGIDETLVVKDRTPATALIHFWSSDA